MRATYQVTSAHIASGDPDTMRGCPVALAVSEQSGFRDVRVMPIYLTGTGADGQALRASLPRHVTTAILALHDRAPVEPFPFTVDWEAA